MVNFVNILVTIVVTLAKWMNFWKNKGGHLTQPTTRLALRQYVVNFLHFRVKLQQLFLDCKYPPPTHTHTLTHTRRCQWVSQSVSQWVSDS